MYNGASRWGQAFDHWCLAVFSFWCTWLYGGVTCFVFLLSFPLSLPFDLTLSYWVYVCCFVLLYFGCYVMLCYVMLCYYVMCEKKKKKLIKKKKKMILRKCLTVCSRISPQSWYWRWRESVDYSLPPLTIPAGPETRSRDLWVTSPTLYPLGHDGDSPHFFASRPVWNGLYTVNRCIIYSSYIHYSPLILNVIKSE